jgi:hypothetical protein
MRLTTLFTATVAVVLLLFVGWSLLSDSNESRDSGNIQQVLKDNRLRDSVISNAGVSKPTPVNAVNSDEAEAKDQKDIAQITEVAEVDKTADSNDLSANKAAGQTKVPVQQSSLKGNTQRTDPGNMPNEKFVRDLERYQLISQRNYEEILRLVKQ